MHYGTTAPMTDHRTRASATECEKNNPHMTKTAWIFMVN